MRIEYMLSREAYPAPLIRVEVAGLEKSELPNISGAISINGQEEVDISLTLIANDVVRIQGQRIDLAVTAHGNEKWSGLFEQIFLIYKWKTCGVTLPLGPLAATR